ncbi:hypothetical protein [Methylocaldum sp.]|uniref:hypothetical protein n=1 Tax=Methylocaldum sp. TaxID=1969727 RepID=UPI002D5CABEE|nr:hypothetical protein [Methylocaldum sp.]HYE35659.1 hypothetical protein [Methylocaldum sp.]
MTEQEDDDGELELGFPAFDTSVATGEPYPIDLDGFEEFGEWKAVEAWAEPGVFPNGQECVRIYLFSETDIAPNGEKLAPENYPFNDDHIAQIRFVTD